MTNCWLTNHQQTNKEKLSLAAYVGNYQQQATVCSLFEIVIVIVIVIGIVIVVIVIVIVVMS